MPQWLERRLDEFQPNLTAVLGIKDGWPTQARFWLEWGSSTAGRWTKSSCHPFLVSCRPFRLDLRASDAKIKHRVPPTPQMIALAMICSGRDDRIEKI
jgi:hypothetical protein